MAWGVCICPRFSTNASLILAAIKAKARGEELAFIGGKESVKMKVGEGRVLSLSSSMSSFRLGYISTIVLSSGCTGYVNLKNTYTQRIFVSTVPTYICVAHV